MKYFYKIVKTKFADNTDIFDRFCDRLKRYLTYQICF